ncbi:hypothetical protein HDV06_001530 [Boothiomyces sp. JEL0866]|nr:hypothetical protein HDV06_001530 [Boothiomyces sp. JEL0866]
MDAAILVKWLVFSATLGLLIVSLYLIALILKGKFISASFKPKVLAILLVTIPQTIFIMYNIIDNYNSHIQRFPAILAEIAEYLECLFNIHILQVFSVLNPNITNEKLYIWKIFVTLVFMGSISVQLWIIICIYTIGISKLVLDLNGWISTACTVFAVIYDNIQGIYLIYLVLKNKKRRGPETAKVLHRLMLSFLSLAVMDWLGVIEFLSAILFTTISENVLLYNSMLSFAELYTCIHGVFMIYIFKQLTDFTFVDHKKKPVELSKVENTVLELTLPIQKYNGFRPSDISKGYVARIPGFLAQCTEFIICLFNIHILQVFSLLNPNITAKKLLAWKIFVTILFFLSIIGQIWILCVIDANYIPLAVLYWNGLASTAFTVFCVLYDNIQGLYLIYLVLKNKKKKGKEAVRILNGLVASLVFLALMDWFGIIVYCAALFVPSIAHDYALVAAIITFVETYTGIHGIFIIYLLKQLTEFTFVDSKRPKLIKTPQNVPPPEPEATIGKKTIPLHLLKGEAHVPISREPSSQPATVL